MFPSSKRHVPATWPSTTRIGSGLATPGSGVRPAKAAAADDVVKLMDSVTTRVLATSKAMEQGVVQVDPPALQRHRHVPIHQGGGRLGPLPQQGAVGRDEPDRGHRGTARVGA